MPDTVIHAQATHPRQTGFTLFEVLIALLILSIGLLGLAGLQAMGLRNNHRAYLRTQAVMQAYDMADRMRANLRGVSNGDYDNITTPVPSIPACITNPPISCTPDQMAQYDSYAWNTENASLLPGGWGTVTKLNNGQYQVTIHWTDQISKAPTPNAIPSTLTIDIQP